jgi:quercetin dioxygenase-like cupin family protein
MSSIRRKQLRLLSSNAKILLAFAAGILVDRTLLRHLTPTGPLHGAIKQLDDTPSRPTSHIDQHGKSIMKQQLLDAFVVPNFVGYSVATFEPGQSMMPPHEHQNMHEFFYVISGSGVISIDEVEHEMKPGSFYHLAPHERHGIRVPGNGKEAMKMAVFGVTA